MVHYTDLRGLGHLDKVGESVQRGRGNMSIYKPGTQKLAFQRKCPHSTSGSGGLLLKNLGSNLSTGSFGPKNIQALGPSFIPETETKPFCLM